jgi:hypothetical protein
MHGESNATDPTRESVKVERVHTRRVFLELEASRSRETLASNISVSIVSCEYAHERALEILNT